MPKNKLKVGTDFSGIGSPEAALKREKIPHETVFACDIDKYARLSYLQIHKAHTMYEDITTRDHTKIPPLDLYIAGFPCQAFSMSGKRLGFEDTKGTLFFNTAEFIKINQPKVFILENVKGLLSHDNGKTFQTIVDVLSNGGGTVNGQMSLDVYEDGLGYHIYYQVLNTKDYGIPQNRERIFIVGFKNYTEFTFPKPFHLQLKLKDLLQQQVDEKYYLSEKFSKYLKEHKEKEKEKGNGFGFSNGLKTGIASTIQTKYGSRGTDTFLDYSEETDFDIGAIRGRNPQNPKSRKTGAPTQQMLEINENKTANALTTVQKDNVVIENKILGYTRDKKGKVVKRSEQNHANTLHTSSGTGNNTDQFVIEVPSANKKGFEIATQNDSINLQQLNSKTRRGRVGKNVSQTIETANKIGVINNTRIRRLTPLECWRLQGFTDEEFYKAQQVNSDTQLYKQAGNSITVNVMQ